MRPPEVRPRSARRRSLRAALLALVMAAAATRAEVAPEPFWDAYLRVRRVVVQAPDSVLGQALARLRADPDDFLAAWSAGRAAALARDSVVIRRAASGDEAPGAGAWVTRAVLALEAGRRGESHRHYRRAAEAYAQLGRPLDASRALVLGAMQADLGGDSTIANGMFARAESLARAASDPATIADVLIARSVPLYDRSPGSARDAREEAVRLLAPLGPSSQLANAHRGLGNVLKFDGEFDGAEREFRAASEVATRLGDSLLAGQALGGLGNVQLARAEFDEALASYTRALALARSAGQPSTMLQRHGDLATLHLRLGHLAEARSHLEEAERLVAGARPDAQTRVQLLDSRAALAALEGRFDPSRVALDSAIDLATRSGAPTTVPLLRLHLASIAASLGEEEEAERLASRGQEEARLVGHRRAEALLAGFRAERLLHAGRTREALAAARELEAMCGQALPQQLGTAARIQASALADLGRTGEALARLDRDVARASAAGDTGDVAQSLSFASELHMLRGDTRGASRLAGRAYELLRVLGDSATAFTAGAVAGQAALRAGRPQEAVRWLRPALEHEERIGSRLRSSDDRAGHRSVAYERAVLLAEAYARSGAPERALEVLERTRARELWRLLARRSAGLRTHVDPALAGAMEAAERELEALQGLRLKAASDRQSSRRGLAGLDARIDSLKARHADVARAVQRSAPQYGAASAALPPLSIERMRAALAAGEQVHWFMVGRERTVHWRLDRAGLRARVLARGEAWWAQRVAGLVAGLRSGADRARTVAGLGDSLLGGWSSEGPLARVHVVPDGPLHDLPFDALTVSVPGRGPAVLLDLAEVDEAPSAAMLFADPGRSVFAGGDVEVVAFGDPRVAPSTGSAPASTRGDAFPPTSRLPHTRREVEAIRAAFPGARVYLDDAATEAVFFEQARRSTILHVAAHGFVDDRRPSYSGLALAADTSPRGAGDDGLVQAFEVAESTLGAELATLSACESGTGTLRRGEGLQGLARAFQIAGARRLLVSLWQVEDVETADLMSTFYRRLAAGDTPATALRHAKRESLARQRPASEAVRGVGTRERTAGRGRAASSTWAAFVLLEPRSGR